MASEHRFEGGEEGDEGRAVQAGQPAQPTRWELPVSPEQHVGWGHRSLRGGARSTCAALEGAYKVCLLRWVKPGALSRGGTRDTTRQVFLGPSGCCVWDGSYFNSPGERSRCGTGAPRAGGVSDARCGFFLGGAQSSGPFSPEALPGFLVSSTSDGCALPPPWPQPASSTGREI